MVTFTPSIQQRLNKSQLCTKQWYFARSGVKSAHMTTCLTPDSAFEYDRSSCADERSARCKYFIQTSSSNDPGLDAPQMPGKHF